MAWYKEPEFQFESLEDVVQQHRNKTNNAKGKHFERKILAGCRIYSEMGIAEVEKIPEPFSVISKGKEGIFKGRFTASAQPDFQGTLKNGKSIVFEAKYTSKDSIKRSILTEEQMKSLERHNRLGAVAMVCIGIQDDFFFIPWLHWQDMKKIYGHQSLKSAEIEEFRIKYDGAVRFMEYVNNITMVKYKAVFEGIEA